MKKAAIRDFTKIPTNWQFVVIANDGNAIALPVNRTPMILAGAIHLTEQRMKSDITAGALQPYVIYGIALIGIGNWRIVFARQYSDGNITPRLVDLTEETNAKIMRCIYPF